MITATQPDGQVEVVSISGDVHVATVDLVTNLVHSASEEYKSEILWSWWNVDRSTSYKAELYPGAFETWTWTEEELS